MDFIQKVVTDAVVEVVDKAKDELKVRPPLM